MFADLLNEAGDYAGTAYNFAGVLKYTFSQAMVQGRIETGAVRHDLVLGAAYQRSTSQWSNEWYWSHDFDGNIYAAQTFVVTRDIDFSLAPVSEDERQKAIFASDTLYFGSHWQAIVGARFTDYELIDLDGDASVDSSYATDGLSPTFALIFKPAEHTSLYGSYVESMEQGARVGETYANFGEILDATTSKQYELGAKYEVERLTFTTAAFRVERAAQIDQIRNGLRYLTQDGMTIYEGAEAIGRFAVTPQLTAGLGATYLDATIDEVSEDNAALKGRTPSGAARWQIVGNVDYRLPALPGLSVFGNVRYFDDAWYDDANTVQVPSRTLANVGFQYQTRFVGREALIAGSLNNLFDRKYWEMNTFGEGRNGSLSLKVSW
jgi:iron complex outermembrane recepter protein